MELPAAVLTAPPYHFSFHFQSTSPFCCSNQTSHLLLWTPFTKHHLRRSAALSALPSHRAAHASCSVRAAHAASTRVAGHGTCQCHTPPAQHSHKFLAHPTCCHSHRHCQRLCTVCGAASGGMFACGGGSGVCRGGVCRPSGAQDEVSSIVSTVAMVRI